MRLYPFLFIGCLFVAACKNMKPVTTPDLAVKSASVDSDGVFDNLNTANVFKRLFDNPTMEGDVAVWKPDYYDRMTFLDSYDDSCHTAMDTTLHFIDRSGKPCAVTVFATYRYIKDSMDGLKVKISGCHFCSAQVGMALFGQRADGRWEIYQFKKLLTEAGVFGGAGVGGVGEYSLVKIEDNWTALLLKKPISGGTGEEDGDAELYAIESNIPNGYPGDPLKLILSYPYHHSLHYVHGEPDLEENTTLNVVKRKKGYSMIRLITIKNGRRTSRDYRFADGENSFVQVKGR